MESRKFEQYIKEATLAVPQHLRAKMENVAFVLEDEARSAKLQEHQIKFRQTLLGLYQGVPLTKRGAGYTGVLPDKITIFKKPIEKLANFQEENIRQIIHHVVQHEIAHHFGMNESQVQAWEKKRAGAPLKKKGI
jgi:predicted Zn-dependent protease with MMP-like domain